MAYSPPSSAKPFTLNVPDQDLSEWRQLLQLSKLGPDTYEGRQEDRRFGITHKWLSDAKDYWLNEYDWRADEKYINSFPNYKMHIEDIDVHFLALFSEKKDAVPIIFMHGWPGSFIEFLPMCDLIKKQYSAKDLPYHIIVPSLPGYTLSSGGPVDSDFTMQDTARTLNQLMLNLGFDKYLAQGGDVGSFISRLLAETYDACVGIHLNMLSSSQKPDIPNPTPREKEILDNAQKFAARGTAYAQLHATRPSTIGHVLSSSPLALLAWIGEKMLEWSDEDVPLPTILRNVSLYWFTESIPRSLYPYRQLFATERAKFMASKKPTGMSSFPHEISPSLKEIAEKEVNLVSWSEHEHGGHFAALERPQELWADVEAFVKVVWKV